MPRLGACIHFTSIKENVGIPLQITFSPHYLARIEKTVTFYLLLQHSSPEKGNNDCARLSPFIFFRSSFSFLRRSPVRNLRILLPQPYLSGTFKMRAYHLGGAIVRRFIRIPTLRLGRFGTDSLSGVGILALRLGRWSSVNGIRLVGILTLRHGGWSSVNGIRLVGILALCLGGLGVDGICLVSVRVGTTTKPESYSAVSWYLRVVY